MSPTPPASPTVMDARQTESARRITEIDVLRGFALFGISIANTIDITEMPTGASGVAYWGHETLFDQRFFPIFSFLFGLSFGLFLDAAARRTDDPRTVMAARLGFLVPLGALHRLLQPREILLTYAIIGILVLLPASFLPARWLLGLGAAATAAGLAVDGGVAIIPGLFLLGLAVQRYGVENVLGLPTGRLGIAFTLCVTAAVALNVWQIRAGGSDTWLGALAGLVTAVSYLAALLLLLRTRAGRAVRTLAPVGRMALTCYIGATVLVVVADQFLELGKGPDYVTAFTLGVCVFVVEMVLSALWLRRARYGPLEWVWRSFTWWTFHPSRTTRP